MKAVIVPAVFLAILLTAPLFCFGQRNPSVLLIILNQNHPSHIARAAEFQKRLDIEKAEVNDADFTIRYTSESYDGIYDQWTIINILRDVDEKNDENFDWLVVVQDYTQVNLENLAHTLSKYDFTEPQFIGRALHDRQPVIIHHFAFAENPASFQYPDFSPGFALSIATFHEKQLEKPHQFSIDAKHELAMTLKDIVKLTHDESFCAEGGADDINCATDYSGESLLCSDDWINKKVTEDDIFVLVKTGEIFHSDRVPLQKKLWTYNVDNLEYCSETDDPEIPTVKLDVENTRTGHCAKFQAMIHRGHTQEHIRSKDWIVIVDDDTMMNITRLTALLSCYNSSEPVFLGERYCYGSTTECYYDYITGGGGTVLSIAAIDLLVTEGFKCYKDNEPDDMKLGSFIKMNHLSILHSPLFHQAPPTSYADEYLSPMKDIAISYHKYTDIKPETIATEFLGLTLADPTKPKIKTLKIIEHAPTQRHHQNRPSAEKESFDKKTTHVEL